MQVFGWSADNTGCGYYRMQLPLQQLGLHGHQIKVDTQMPAAWRDRSDVIVGQRVCLPGPSSTWQRLAADGRFLVYEIDDDLFTIDPSSPAHGYFNGPGMQQRIRANIEVSSRVLVSTPVLADRLAHLHPDIRVLPNMVPRWLLGGPGHPIPAGPSRFDDGHGRGQDGVLPCTLGWAGSPSHGVDWADLAGPISRVVVRDPRMRLHLMGWIPPGITGAINDRFQFTKWTEPVEKYLLALDRFDIALAPLAPHVFNACKSDLRLLELAARAIPTVVSAYGPYSEWVQPEATGLVFRLPHEAVRQVRRLAHDPQLRQAIGTAAHQAVQSRVIEDNWKLWEEALTL